MGCLQLDHTQRWTPEQTSGHPFLKFWSDPESVEFFEEYTPLPRPTREESPASVIRTLEHLYKRHPHIPHEEPLRPEWDRKTQLDHNEDKWCFQRRNINFWHDDGLWQTEHPHIPRKFRPNDKFANFIPSRSNPHQRFVRSDRVTNPHPITTFSRDRFKSCQAQAYTIYPDLLPRAEFYTPRFHACAHY